MIENMESLDRRINIVGFKDVKIKDAKEFLKKIRKEVRGTIQFFDAKLISGKQHLYFAALNALHAFKRKENISNSLSMESLLYASAQRQIKKALRMVGIKDDSSQVAVLIIGENRKETNQYLKVIAELTPGERDDGVIELTEQKIEDVKSLFEISDLEVGAKLKREGLEKEALTDLVIEHMALLAIKR